MRKLLTITMAILATLVWKTSAQENENKIPDFKKIEFEVSNPSSQFYYPKLMERYAIGDTTLNATEYHYLYYGFVSQPAYKPLMPQPMADSLQILFSKRTNPTIATFEKAEKYVNVLLEQNPFSLRDLNLLAFALEKLDKPQQAALQIRKVRMIEQTIKATGTGLTEKSPWYIIFGSNGDDILALMGLNLSKTIIISKDVEFLQVQNMPEELKRYSGYYFNYSQIYLRKPDYLDDVPKQKRRMEINNTRPWETFRK